MISTFHHRYPGGGLRAIGAFLLGKPLRVSAACNCNECSFQDGCDLSRKEYDDTNPCDSSNTECYRVFGFYC